MASFMTIYIATVTAVLPRFFPTQLVLKNLDFCLTVMLKNCPAIFRMFQHLFQTFEYRIFFMTLVKAFRKLMFLVPQLRKANIFLHLSESSKVLECCKFCMVSVNTFKYFWMYTLCFKGIRTSLSEFF